MVMMILIGKPSLAISIIKTYSTNYIRVSRKQQGFRPAGIYKFHTALNNWRAEKLNVSVTNLINTFDDDTYEHMDNNDMIYISMMTRDTNAHVEVVTEEIESVLGDLKTWREGGEVQDDTVGVFDDGRDFVSLFD